MENKKLEKKDKIKKILFILVSALISILGVFWALCGGIFTIPLLILPIIEKENIEFTILFWMALPSIIWGIFLILVWWFIKNKLINKK